LKSESASSLKSREPCRDSFRLRRKKRNNSWRRRCARRRRCYWLRSSTRVFRRKLMS